MNETIMVKLTTSENYIIFRIVTMDRHKRKEFYVRRDELLAIRTKKSLTAFDGNFAVFNADEERDELRIRFYWHNSSGETFTGRVQIVVIPFTETILFAEDSAFTVMPNKRCFLARDPNCKPKLIFKSNRRLAEVASNKQIRRKLVKTLPHCFNWPSATEIRLYDDFEPYSFFFCEYRGENPGICGGLILHGQDNMDKAYYSVHT